MARSADEFFAFFYLVVNIIDTRDHREVGTADSSRDVGDVKEVIPVSGRSPCSCIKDDHIVEWNVDLEELPGGACARLVVDKECAEDL